MTEFVEDDEAQFLDLRGVENLLSLQEKPQLVIYEHWISVWRPMLAAVAAPAFFLLAVLSAPANSGAAIKFLGVLLILVWGWAAYKWLDWHARRTIVTNRRLIQISGLFTVKKAMMPLTKVTDMSYLTTVTGRMIGYATFKVESAGQDQGITEVANVPHADYYYRQISTLIFDKEEVAPQRAAEQDWAEWDESAEDEDWADEQGWGAPGRRDHGFGRGPNADSEEPLWEPTGELPVYDPHLDPYLTDEQRPDSGPRRWVEEYRARHRK